MSRQHHPGEDNIFSLRQGIDLIQRIDDATYAGHPEDRGGVGSQIRHCVDFYDCFLRGLGAGQVDYSARERDRRVEVDRAHAVQRIEALIEQLARLDPALYDDDVLVRLERADPAQREPDWCRSSVLRELQFLFSHTIHHYALIANLLAREGLRYGAELEGFGVAPSTLEFWQQTGRLDA
jgi:hypothetical protein